LRGSIVESSLQKENHKAEKRTTNVIPRMSPKQAQATAPLFARRTQTRGTEENKAVADRNLNEGKRGKGLIRVKTARNRRKGVSDPSKVTQQAGLEKIQTVWGFQPTYSAHSGGNPKRQEPEEKKTFVPGGTFVKARWLRQRGQA